MNSASPKNSVFLASAAAAMALAPAAVLLFLAPGAAAQTPTRTVAVEVYVGDIPAGQPGDGQVGARIEAAARSACAAVASRTPLLPREQADCVRASVTEAMTRVADKRGATILASAD